MKSQELRKLALQMLEVRKIPVEYEEIVSNADVPYELTIRKLLRGVSLQEALNIVEVPTA